MRRDINQIRVEDGEEAARQAIEKARQKLRQQKEQEVEMEESTPEMPDDLKAFLDQMPLLILIVTTPNPRQRARRSRRTSLVRVGPTISS
jgi:hypothetical protein